ncbi:hypothetical protein [Actinophytocola gossypii]|uniref:ESX-1 secretion-associated protein n=1 Tax=Actinophytocola gossypii TaxID=2812003 RepID=A0ABT2J3B2_9PSEU|nr:hypothetical protein [Actinophytocola gossypii]MCT2582343.1 hypothetical protein [Actinophytocola gossypii]
MSEYRIDPDELAERITALTALADETGALVASAGKLAEHLPMLGTAPPAQHSAARLSAAAGPDGLTGAVRAANAELDGFHRALRATADSYAATDATAETTLRTAEDRS